MQKRREDSEETSQELRLAREQLQNTVPLPDFPFLSFMYFLTE